MKVTKKQALFGLIFILAITSIIGLLFTSCTKPGYQKTVQMVADGTGTYEVGFNTTGQWEKLWAEDFWQITANVNTEDTIYLAAYGNADSVMLYLTVLENDEILDIISQSIPPGQYYMINYIVNY
ncbi:MAG: hypothetical protein WC222_11635 [Parachlamydiales bacterium]|jgi:hypothetical protein